MANNKFAMLFFVNKILYTKFYFVLLAALTILGAIVVYANNIMFQPVHNVLLGIIIIIIELSLFIKTHILYKQINDKRMVFLAASFLSGAVFELFHVIYSDTITLQFIFWYAESFSILSGVLLPIFYFNSSISIDSAHFQRKVYFFYFVYTFSLALLLNYQGVYFGALALSLPFETMYIALFVLCAFIYFDLRVGQKLSLFSPFVIGIAILAFSEIFEPSLFYIQSEYRFILHFIHIWALSLIYIGIKDIIFTTHFFSIKHKFMLYHGLFISILYFFTILYTAVFLGFDFHSYFKYMFFVIFLILIISGYILTLKITKPLTNIIEGILKNIPGKEPTPLKIISNDEIGLLTKEFNQNSEFMYKYNIEISKTAEKEKILRQIVSAIKVSQDFESIYNYLITQICIIFKIQRTLFLETPTHKFEKPSVKYEYLNSVNLVYIKKEQLPDLFLADIIGHAEQNRKLIISNIDEYYKDNKHVKGFFYKYKVKSLLAVPFSRYNKHVKIFGILVMCDVKERHWSGYEINLIESIAESVVSVIWDIIKITEINQLRDTFIATLAHDLQVPLVSENKALEFLAKQSESQSLGNYKFIIEEMLTNNQDIITLLKKLLDVYYYESGKKTLKIDKYNAENIIKEVVEPFKKTIEAKFLDFKIDIQENLPLVYFDVNEVKKSVHYMLDNAITYTPSGGTVIVKAFVKKDIFRICISDTGPGIIPELKEKLLERYAMAHLIERKIGGGLSLYLCKLISDAHDGCFKVQSEIGIGSEFCILLPQNL